MAGALLGKVCIGLLALVVLVYTCCYGFRIRDGGPQPSSLDQRATCDGGTLHGKACTETVPPRRWHEAVASRFASTRKPPVEPSSSDDGGVQTEGTRERFEKGESWRDRLFGGKGGRVGVVDTEEEDTEEILAEEDEESLEEEREKVEGGSEEETDEDEDEGGEESEDEEEGEGEEVVRRISRKEWKRSVEETEDRGRKIVRVLKPSKGIEEEEEEEGEGDEDDSEVEEKAIKKEELKKSEREAKDTDEGKEKDLKVQPASTPPPKKLDKVKYADRDKGRSAEAAPSKSAEKKSVETKKPSETTRRDESAVKPTKPSEVSKRKDAAKPEEKPKAAVKSEAPSKSKDQTKEVKEAKAKKVEVESTGRSEPSEKKKPKQNETKRTEASVTLAELNDAILHVPTFVPNFTGVVDPECQQHGKIFLRQLRGYKLWALQMLDSNAKIPSGLLRGNVNQLGDFDQCLGAMAHVKVDGKTVKVQGKYCLATVDLHASHPDMKLPVNLMQGRAFTRGSIRDPGHFIPKANIINWAVCLPAACSAEDAENTLEHALSTYNATTGIRFTVDVDPGMCYVKQKSRSYSKETIGVLYFYAMVICLVIVATLRDYIVKSEGKGNYSERIIMSFSLRRTVKQLFTETTGVADITCIHGLRALAMAILYVAHQVLPLLAVPLANRVSFVEITNNPFSTILRTASCYTDTFLLLSGVLTAYIMAHELSKRGEIRWFCRLIGRLVRFTPPLLAVVFWYAFVMEHIATGPQWNNMIATNADLCKRNAWTNLLYIQNFLPFEEICATHTYQLALSMQLSLLAPPLVFFLQYKPLIGIIMLFFCILLSATLRYIAMTGNNLSLVVYHGATVRQLYKTANLTHILPLHRLSPYVLGVGLGVLLNYTGKNVRMHKILVILGWSTATALGLWSLLSPWRTARRDYVYNVEEATHHGVIGPLTWSLFLCWTIFACFTDHGGVVNKFLCSYWLTVLSRISYAVYLTQMPVFLYNVATTRHSRGFHVLTPIDTLELITVLLASVVLTLLFDLPMQEVKNVVMEATDAAKLPAEQEASAEDEGKPLKGDDRPKAFEEDEVASTGWDWQKDIVEGAPRHENEGTEDEELPIDMPIRKSEERRMSFVARDKYETEGASVRDRFKRLPKDEEEYMERGRHGRASQIFYTHDDSEEEIEFLRAQQQREDLRRGRRSQSRNDSRRSYSREPEAEGYSRRKNTEDRDRQFRRSESRGRSSTRTDPSDPHSREFVGKERSSSNSSEVRRPPSRGPPEDCETLIGKQDARRTLSSGGEGEPAERESKRHANAEPRVSDEEDWEHELRIRRKRFMEKLASQRQSEEERAEEEGYELKRRSSAEGRIALLKEPSDDDNMDSWTVSVDPRISRLGSSQEPSEPEEDTSYPRRREYREQAPPSREDTQSEEENSWDGGRNSEEEVSSYNFVLTRDSKRISVQDLSKLQEDTDLDAAWRKESDGSQKSTSLGLFKRESIIKSQASEEDPEYLLPERPKLVEQEREHPFKKAWQMQKSRSEEDGSSAYAMKDPKEVEAKRKDESKDSEGQMSVDSEVTMGDETEPKVWSNKSTDSEEKTASRSDEMGTESSRGGSRGMEERAESEDNSSRTNWTEEGDASHRTRRKSEETDWDWEQEET